MFRNAVAALAAISGVEAPRKVSSTLLAVAGIGSGEPMRRAVLASVSEAAYRARAEGAIGQRRSAQIVRHVERATSRINPSPGRVA